MTNGTPTFVTYLTRLNQDKQAYPDNSGEFTVETDIALMVAGYAGVRLGIIIIGAYLLYRFVRYSKPVKVEANARPDR